MSMMISLGLREGWGKGISKLRSNASVWKPKQPRHSASSWAASCSAGCRSSACTSSAPSARSASRLSCSLCCSGWATATRPSTLSSTLCSRRTLGSHSSASSASASAVAVAAGGRVTARARGGPSSRRTLTRWMNTTPRTLTLPVLVTGDVKPCDGKTPNSKLPSHVSSETASLAKAKRYNGSVTVTPH
ncbi:uncharacterized serine-rich protein C215.13-like [Ostrinia furnacalis]|uniref:uncharacterized serine-rich protein C215.13-like n=1 Tax=Ostrinia furnacalis TaxID=93504 RepID=UPI00103D9C58|nr:uncharacterized serine-rich protein C215.13-like [Ostrinia furnacalis]